MLARSKLPKHRSSEVGISFGAAGRVQADEELAGLKRHP
jgi:hypothetical protein